MRTLAIAMLATAALTGGAVAQQPTQAQVNAIRQSCRGDYQSYCASVPTGGSASLQCLQQHMTQLSQPCQTAMAAVDGGSSSRTATAPAPATAPSHAQSTIPTREKLAMFRRACGRDFRTWCAGVEPGGGRAMECLIANQQRLSPSCKGLLAEARNR